MNKKFKFTDETIEKYGIVLHHIEAITDFGSVKTGEKGGFVENEKNISESGNAWVSGDAKVYGNAEVSGNAWVYGNAEVFGDAKVFGDAWVYGEIKCETGHYFAYKRREWDVKEIKLDDESVVLWHQ